jgi:hypothetical protein
MNNSSPKMYESFTFARDTRIVVNNNKIYVYTNKETNIFFRTFEYFTMCTAVVRVLYLKVKI